MNVVGIPDENREDILSLIAAILHLGNVNFVEDGNYAKVQNDDCEYIILLLTEIKEVLDF
jgi:myosin-1